MILHETFVVEDVIDAPPARVFTAYADVKQREDWSATGSDAIVYDRADFRSGGGDEFRCGPAGDLRFHGTVAYLDVVANQRFVFVESIRADDQLLSIGLVTWELFPDGQGTRLRATTQLIAFAGPQMVDGAKSGTRGALNKLAAFCQARAR